MQYVRLAQARRPLSWLQRRGRPVGVGDAHATAGDTPLRHRARLFSISSQHLTVELTERLAELLEEKVPVYRDGRHPSPAAASPAEVGEGDLSGCSYERALLQAQLKRGAVPRGWSRAARGCCSEGRQRVNPGLSGDAGTTCLRDDFAHIVPAPIGPARLDGGAGDHSVYWRGAVPVQERPRSPSRGCGLRGQIWTARTEGRWLAAEDVEGGAGEGRRGPLLEHRPCGEYRKVSGRW